MAAGFALAAILGTFFPAYVCASGVTIGLSPGVLSRLLRDSPIAPQQ